MHPLEPVYTAISWLMMRWHDLWHAVGVPDRQVLGTNWSWVLSIIFLVITVRIVLFPLYVKQIKSQRAMQAIQPKVKELQAKYKNDRQTMQQELMQLYRQEKANPLMGCLPLLLQAPVLFSLFHVLRHLSPDRHLKTLYGWTVPLFDSASSAKLFGAPLAAGFKADKGVLADLHASLLNVQMVSGVLVALMIITTFLTQYQMIARTGWATDPQQKMMQRLMLFGVPVMLLISGSIFPIGVVIYWTTTNLFSLGQQMWILHKYPPPPGTTTKSGKDSGKPGTGRIGGRKAAAKAAEEAAAKTAAAKKLAPKPGAKPVNPKKKSAASPAKSAPAAKSASATKSASADKKAPAAKKPSNGTASGVAAKVPQSSGKGSAGKSGQGAGGKSKSGS